MRQKPDHIPAFPYLINLMLLERHLKGSLVEVFLRGLLELASISHRSLGEKGSLSKNEQEEFASPPFRVTISKFSVIAVVTELVIQMGSALTTRSNYCTAFIGIGWLGVPL